MRNFLLLVLLSFMLVGCAINTVADPGEPGQSGAQMTLSDADRQRCIADGGKVERAGVLGAERCTRPYSDGGQNCTDSSQCEGQCRVDVSQKAGDRAVGVCQADDNPFGCHSVVEKGVVAFGLCVD